MPVFGDPMTPVYAEQVSPATAPSFDFVKRNDLATTTVTKTYSSDELADIMKQQFTSINKNVIDELMDLLFNLKKDKNITHQLRIQIFAKLLECTEKEAKKYYKVFKMIWKFQNLKSELVAFLKGKILVN